MKSLVRGDWWRFVLPLMIFSLVGGINLVGCAGGDEFFDEGDEWEEGRVLRAPPTHEMVDSLENELSALKQQNARLEAERRSLNARVAELETNLSMERERVKEMEVAPRPKPRMAGGTGGSNPNYDNGLSMFRNRDYQGAMEAFLGLLEGGVGDHLADNAHYWIGESLYAMKRYNEAIEYFNPVFAYRVSEKKDDAQLMIANCYVRMGNSAIAKTEYQKLIENYPSSEYVQFARNALAKLR